MQTRQVTLQAPATNTTQNYEVTGFGTPQAAIVLASLGGSGSWSGHGVVSLGFWDGTSQNVTGAGWQNGGSPGSNDSRHFGDASNVVMQIYEGSTVNRRKASITATATNGVTLTWTGTNTGDRPYVTVILIKGCNGVQTGHRTATKTNAATDATTTTGMTPKLVLFAGRRSDTATGHGSSPGVFWGMAADNGATIDNFSVGWRNVDTDPTDCNGQVTSSACIPFDINTAGQLQHYCAVTAMASGSFTTTTTTSGTPLFSSHFYLALDFAENVKAFSSATPTVSGDYDPVTVSFTPQWFFAFPTGFAALNTDYSGAQDGLEGLGIYSVNTDSDEDGHYATMENGSTGAGNMFGQATHDVRLQIDEVTATPTSSSMITGSSPTFDSSGIVYADANFSHDTGQAHQIIGFLVQEQVAGLAAKAAYHYNRMRNPF